MSARRTPKGTGRASKAPAPSRRRRRFGHVRQLRSGHWQASYLDRLGIRHHAASTYLTKEGAEQFLVLIEASMLRGEWIDPARQRETFLQWSGRWMETAAMHLAPKTRETYKSIIRVHLLPALAPLGLGDIDHMVALEVFSAMEKAGYNPKTITNAKNCLSAIMATAVVCGIIRANPCTRIKLPRGAPFEWCFLTADQVDDLAVAIIAPLAGRAGAARYLGPFPAHGLAVRVAATTGARAGELWAIRRQSQSLGHV